MAHWSSTAWHDDCQAFAEDRRAPVLFDVLNHKFDFASMANVRWVARVIQSVGQIAAEDDVFSEVLLLSDAERTTKDAHVGVHTHEDDVLPAFLLEEVVDLDAPID